MFEITGAKLVIDTSQLDAATKKIDDLAKAVAKVERESSKSANKASSGSAAKQEAHVKAYGKAVEEASKKATSFEKLLNKLAQTHTDLSNEFTRGESSVLRYARSLGANDRQLELVVTHLKDIKSLTKDPFDSAIGSLRRLSGEFESLNSRAELAAKGIKLTQKQANEYSKLANEVAGKMKGQGLDPAGNEAEYTRRLTKAKEDYLAVAQKVNALNRNESGVVGGGRKSGAVINEGDLLAAKFVANENKKALAAEKADQRIIDSLEKRTSKIQALTTKAGMPGVDNSIDMNRIFQANALRGTGYSSMGSLFDSGKTDVIKSVKENILAQKALHEQNTRTVKSTRELAFAMRQVPMQITDIAVSLAGGQSPFQVLMQQGGQLKDLFGGVKEAAMALATGLKDALVSGFKLLLNPIVAAIGVIGLFGAAVWKAIDRSEQFNKSLILMGNTTKLALLDVEQTSVSISKLADVSMSKAGNAMIELSKASGLTGEPLKNLTAAAVALEKHGGASVEETAKAISSLKAEPLSAMLELNKQTGFLTTEIVRQANEYVQAGDKAKAVALLVDALTESQKRLAEQLKENKGAFATLFDYLGEKTTKFFDYIGRESLSVVDRMAEPFLQLLGLMDKVDKRKSAGQGGSPEWATGGVLSLGKRAMASGSERADALQNIINFANRNNKDAKLKSTRSEVDAWVSKLSEEDRLKNADVIRLAKASSEYTGLSERKKDPFDYKNQQQDYLRQQLSKDKKESEDMLQKYARQSQEVEKINTNIQEQIDLQMMQIENQTKGLGLTEKEKFVREELAKLEANRLKTLNDISMNATLTPEQQALQTEVAKKKYDEARKDIKTSAEAMYDQTHSFTAGWDVAFAKYQDQAKNAAAFGESAFTKMTDGMTDAIMEFVETGKVSFGSLSKSIIADIMRMQLKANISQLFGNSSGSGSGIGGLLGSLATAFLGGRSSAGATTTAGPSAATGMSGSWLGSGQSLNMSAKGNAFSPYGLQAFANGGMFTNSIVSDPTLFKFANGGKFGVMGEAGAEAVMPLSRDSSGKLGVSVNSGSTGAVSVVINNNGNPVDVTSQNEVTDSRGNRRIELTIADAAAKEQSRPGSAMHNSTKNAFGLKTSLVQR